MQKFKTGIAIAVMALLAPMAQAAVFSNGGFEASTTTAPSTTIGLDGSLGAWTVTSGSVDLVYSYWTPSEGYYSLGLNGKSAGSIEQTFDTIKGKTYTVSFDMAGEPYGTKLKSMLVGIDDEAKTYTFDMTGKSTSNMGWVHQSFTFVAADTQSTLSFSGFGYNKAYGVALDNVKVVPEVPEPMAYGMLLGGLGILGVIGRRKQKSK